MRTNADRAERGRRAERDEDDSEITGDLVLDSWGRSWPSDWELCPVCHQPDNTGDCNHKPYTDEERQELLGEDVDD